MVADVDDATEVAIAGTAAGQTVDDNTTVSPFSAVTISDADTGETVTVKITLSSGDVNGSCSYNGLDITYGVAYFKGGSDPIPCPDCPPVE